MISQPFNGDAEIASRDRARTRIASTNTPDISHYSTGPPQ